MLSRYALLCRVIDCGSFTKAAEALGYSQSAVSQQIKALEQEMGTTLIDRRKDGIRLSADGRQYYPYLQAIVASETALLEKKREMDGLEKSVIRIGTFTGVSRSVLPRLLRSFKRQYPGVSFILRQGDYTSIGDWVQNGSVDFGFVHADAVADMQLRELYREPLLAVLPTGHPLAAQAEVSLQTLAAQPLILLDEGDYNVLRTAFCRQGLTPRLEYEVTDDYTILSMVRQGLGVSCLYRRVLVGFADGVELRPIRERPERTICLAWRSWQTMPSAARRFADYITHALQAE